MPSQVLITGGAGFIGSHICDELLAHGYLVRILDNYLEQVHGQRRPDYLDAAVEVFEGDVRDPAAVRRALAGVDGVIHLAAMVGVGQSMYQLADYVAVNDLGTAILLEGLIEGRVPRLVVASSMSVYGEGLYRDAAGRPAADVVRRPAGFRDGHWDPCGDDGRPLVPVPTPEDKPPALNSAYAVTKYAQERLCLTVCRAYGIAATALRMFNAYGPRQALSNPYTGVLAIFASRILNGRRPVVFEDGRQRRDFIDVRDAARAFRLALETPAAAGQVLNIAGGRSLPVMDAAALLAHTLGRPDLEPELAGRYRAGDVRHCFADVRRARAVLGFEAAIPLEAGIADLAVWLAGQEAVDRFDEANRELTRRGLVA